MHAGKELPSVGKKACVNHCDEIIVHIPYSECTKKPHQILGCWSRLYRMFEWFIPKAIFFKTFTNFKKLRTTDSESSSLLE